MSLRDRVKNAVQETAPMFMGIPDAVSGEESESQDSFRCAAEEGRSGRENKRRCKGRKPSPVVAGAIGLACAVAICSVVGSGTTMQLSDGGTNPQSLADIDQTGAEEGQSDADSSEDSGKTDDFAPLEEICVYVTGAVKYPGVYNLAENARVNDAVEAAGGLQDNAAAASVNLARPISDGEQIDIPTKSKVKDVQQKNDSTVVEFKDGNATNPGKNSAGAKININTASAEELLALPGIGETLAARIVDDRAANGPFAIPSDLMRVSGIGEKKYAEMESMIAVG